MEALADAIKDVYFAPYQSDGNRSFVDVYRNANISKRNRVEIRLCTLDEPIVTKFGLDVVREGENPDRRGLALKIVNKATTEALQALDERVIQTAVDNSQQWFKKTLTRDQVEARYKPILSRREDESFYTMKIKVKVGNSAVPTNLHLRDEDGSIRKKGGRVEHLEAPKARVVPIVSTSSVWFMGGGSSFGLSFQAEDMIVTPGAERDDLDRFGPEVSQYVVAAAEEPPITGEVRVTLEEAEDDDGVRAM